MSMSNRFSGSPEFPAALANPSETAVHHWPFGYRSEADGWMSRLRASITSLRNRIFGRPGAIRVPPMSAEWLHERTRDFHRE